MPATFRLATDADMRKITSINLAPLDDLPHLYIPVSAVDIALPPLDIPTEGVDLMRNWGIAHERSLPDYLRLFPSALVTRRNAGQFVARDDLLYHGAETAADHVAALQSNPGSTAFE